MDQIGTQTQTEEKMKHIILTIIGLLSVALASAQIAKDGELFTDVKTVDGNVVFIKEINLPDRDSSTFSKLREWAKENFGKDPFVSSVRYDAKNMEIIAKSRIELLLPPDSKNVKEKVVMRYRLNAFIFQNKCVLEVKSISYMLDASKKALVKQTVQKAEDMIVDSVIKTDDPLFELKKNTQKSTIYFLNELALGLEKAME